MTDKHLEELQDILKDAFTLQSKMKAYMHSIMCGGNDGVTLDVYPHQYMHLRNADEYIDSAIPQIWEEIGVEMKKRGQL